MSTGVNYRNGDSGSVCDNEPLTSNNNNAMNSSTPQNKGQKSKKRRDQKTFDLSELFDKHQSSVGNWADAALENSFHFPHPSPTQQNAPSAPGESTQRQQQQVNRHHDNRQDNVQRNDVRLPMHNTAPPPRDGPRDGFLSAREGYPSSHDGQQQHAQQQQHASPRAAGYTSSRDSNPRRSSSHRRRPSTGSGSEGGRASHSRQQHPISNYIPENPPFQVHVANINYAATEEDLFFFFGGEDGGVREVLLNEAQGPKAMRGTATVTFFARGAAVNALKFDGSEAQGRALRVYGQRPPPPPPRNDYQASMGPMPVGQYRSNSYAGMDAMASAYTNSLPPRPRGSQSYNYHQMPPYPNQNPNLNLNLNYDNYAPRNDRQQPQQPYEDRRNSYGTRPMRYPSNTLPNNYPRQNRPYGGRHSMYENGSQQYRGSSHDISYRGRPRTDSVTSMPPPQTGGPSYHEEPHSRPKLELQPRSTPVETGDAQPVRKSSIFGDAKPVDTSEKERQAEERLRLEDEAFRRSTSSTRKLSGDHGHHYGKVTLMKSASHDGVHGMMTKQTSVVEEPLLEEPPSSIPPRHNNPPPLSPAHLPPRPPSRLGSHVPSTPPPVQRYPNNSTCTMPIPAISAIPDSVAMPPPPVPLLKAATTMPMPHPPAATANYRRPSPARSVEKENLTGSMGDISKTGGRRSGSKQNYSRTFTRSSNRARTPQQQNQQFVPQQGAEPMRRGSVGNASFTGPSSDMGGVVPGPVMDEGTAGKKRRGGGSRRGRARRGGSGASRRREQSSNKTGAEGGKEPAVEEQKPEKEVVKEPEPPKEPEVKEEKPVAPPAEPKKSAEAKKESRKKKDKERKQAAKELLKLEQSKMSFSSRNKFAALVDADE